MSQLRWMPGDRREPMKAMVRVDQAGEYGATRIYAGQLAVLGDRHPASRAIHHMAEQEERHRAFFDRITAAISPKAAMACTAAVETEIDKHYQAQLDELGDSDPELSEAIADFQAEELEHRDHALGAGAEEAIAYPLLYGMIWAGCKLAIAAAKRI